MHHGVDLWLKEAWFWGKFKRGNEHGCPWWVKFVLTYLAVTYTRSYHGDAMFLKRQRSSFHTSCFDLRSSCAVCVDDSWLEKKKVWKCGHFQIPHRQDPCFFSAVPSQPVPPLSQTLHGYLKALEPLLPPGELSHTRRMVQEFGRPGGLGSQLQDGLERRAMETKNWVRVVSGWEMWQMVQTDMGVFLQQEEFCHVLLHA